MPINYNVEYPKMQRIVWELREEVKRLRKELREKPGFHHPDCNWWKWDWRYSWSEYDCTCDKVAGPSLEQTQGRPASPFQADTEE